LPGSTSRAMPPTSKPVSTSTITHSKKLTPPPYPGAPGGP
jgi:hypothetical protein